MLSRIVREAIARGWSILPIGHDKRPIINTWKQFQKTPASKDVIADWAGLPDRRGWATVAGAVSGVVIYDFDGIDGAGHLESWGVRPHVRTPSGGHHVYVRHPGWPVKTFNAKSLKDPAFRGVDIRADGGYAGFDGRMDSGAYAILRSLEELVEAKDVPEALRRYAGIDAPPEPAPKSAESKGPANGPRLVNPNNKEPRRIDTYALIDRAIGMLGATGRNDAGFWLAIQIRDNGYSELEAEGVLRDYQRRVPGYDTKGKRAPYSEAEALASVRSAYSQSPREPWTQSKGQRPAPGPKDSDAPPPPPPAEAEANGAGGDDDGPPPANRLGRLIISESGFLSTHGETPLWRYDGVMWRRSSTEELRHLAAVKDGKKTTTRRRNDIANYIRAMSFQHYIQWNRGIGLAEIPLQNGVLDVGTMQLRTHRQEDCADWAVPYAYAPDVQCPLWLETLETLFIAPPDEDSDADETAAIRDAERIKDGRDSIAMLQEYAGYCLMRALPRHALIIKGVPDSGKSLLLSILRKLVGRDACCNVSWEDVSEPRKLAPLAGMRLNTLPEASERGWIADRGFNALLGGDQLAIDRKFENPEMIQPIARHIMLCNELPAIRNYSGAIYKRLLLMEMPRKLSAAEQDKRREERLTPEMAGIVAWAIEGARRLWASDYRFTWPASSRKLLHRYRTEENQAAAFIAECCTTDPDVIVPLSAVCNEFREWADRKNIENREISRMLRGIGLQSAPVRYYAPWAETVPCVVGITLKGPVPDLKH
jgi:P4 family phage/plasmid primase-like protien